VIVVTDPASHAPHEPVMAYLRDADGGEMMLMADTRETTCRDPAVVKRLLAAAPGSTVNGSDVPAPEAPQISKDPAADNADVYALVRPDRPDTVTLISNFVPPGTQPAGSSSSSAAELAANQTWWGGVRDNRRWPARAPQR
jgi:Domain of unknown function (DUF4331)